MEKFTMNGDFPVVMLNYQRVKASIVNQEGFWTLLWGILRVENSHQAQKKIGAGFGRPRVWGDPVTSRFRATLVMHVEWWNLENWW